MCVCVFVCEGTDMAADVVVVDVDVTHAHTRDRSILTHHPETLPPKPPPQKNTEKHAPATCSRLTKSSLEASDSNIRAMPFLVRTIGRPCCPSPPRRRMGPTAGRPVVGSTRTSRLMGTRARRWEAWGVAGREAVVLALSSLPMVVEGGGRRSGAVGVVCRLSVGWGRGDVVSAWCQPAAAKKRSR